MNRELGFTASFAKALLIVLLALLAACADRGQEGDDSNGGQDESTVELRESLREIQQAIAERVGPLSDDVKRSANEQFEKLFAIEYKVIEFDADLSRQSLEQKLNELGKDRWDCFNMKSQGDYVRAYCKRLPRGYMQYLIKMGWII